MQVPEELAAAVSHVVPVVRRFRQFVEQGEAAELEVRLGHQGANGWDANVGAPAFHAMLELLQRFPGWDRVEPHVDSHDYFFTLADGRKVRTSVTFGPVVAITHAHKVAVAGADVKLANQPCDARVSLKREASVSGTELPAMVDPHLVRMKKRWSFYLPKWRIDMTQVWSGVSRSVAEANQARNYCSYEVEVECTCSPATVATLTDEYLALSMLLKLCSLLAQPALRIVPLH